MKTVIDVGCARYGGDFSIERLIDKFHPDVLYGFDPSWDESMFTPWDGITTKVIVSKRAAWTHSGQVRFLDDGLNGQIGDAEHWPFVPCVSLARFIRQLSTADEVILKMDCEGSEYELLEHLMFKGVDERLSLAWIEWHPRGVADPAERRASIERRIRCPLDEWLW
jgi:Methyltransferase FkbM domain